MTVRTAPAALDRPEPDLVTTVVRRGPRLRDGITVDTTDGVLELRYEGTPLLRARGVGSTVLERLAELGGPPRPRRPLTGSDAAAYEKVMGSAHRFVADAVWQDERLVAQAESLRPGARIAPVELSEEDSVRLSKFAYLHRRDDALHVESPIGGARVVIEDPRILGVVGRLSTAEVVRELTCDDACGLAPETVQAVLELLVAIDAVDVAGAGDGDAFASDTAVQRQWDFHDLLFHSRSRFGRTDEAFGGVFPYRGELEPLPPVRPHHVGPEVELPRPDLEEILRRDPALVTAMEGRHSVRHYGEQPLTVEQLGEFLYRVARVRGTYGPMPEGGMPYPASSRPYPCGGAGYELELYLTVRRCAGLAPAVYHYQAETHRLTALPTSDALREQLLDGAALSAGGDVTPDVLVTMTARFQRISWKYRSIAYAVTLKHAGVLYQTMYLVATAMGLGGCGLGSGNSDLSADAFGLDYLEESSVGEFIIGSLPHPLAGAPVPGGNPIGKGGADATWVPHLDPQWYGASHRALRAER